MKPRRSEHNAATDPPGAVSDQNQEEAQSGHRDDRTHPEPRTTGSEPEKQDEERSSGAAGEGSQSTGHPHNAG